MPQTQAQCHRCGGDLPPADEFPAFCPHCAAPQLLLSEACLADPNAGSEATTGAHPPPAPRQVEWQTAIGCAALVAFVAAVLSLLAVRIPVASFLSTVWVLTASLTTLALYQRRRPLAWMDAGIGARIGLTAGLLTVVLMATGFAILGLIARFGLHSLGNFDTAIAQMLIQVKTTAANSASPAPPEVLKLYDIAEFQAGLMLASLATAAVFLLLVSTCGGALGGLLRTRKPATQA